MDGRRLSVRAPPQADARQKAEDLQKALDDIKGVKFYVSELQNTTEIDGNAVLEQKTLKDHFSKLKFNFIELETKDGFLQSLGKDEPFPTSDQVKSFEREIEQQKALVDSAKSSCESLKQTVSENAQQLCNKLTKSNEEIARLTEIIAEIQQMEDSFRDLQMKLEEQDTVTLEEAQETLSQQNKQLTDLKRLCQSRLAVLDEAESQIKALEDEIARDRNLFSELVQTSAQLKSNEELEDRKARLGLEKWYEGISQILWQLSDVSIREVRENELVLELSLPSSQRVFLLAVRLDVSEQKIIGAGIEGTDVYLEDIVTQAIADSWDLPMLVQEVLCRLDCHLRRDTEFSELGKHAKLTFDPSGSRLEIRTPDSMTLSFELDREYPRDTSNFSLDRIDVPEGTVGDLNVVKEMVLQAQPSTITEAAQLSKQYWQDLLSKKEVPSQAIRT